MESDDQPDNRPHTTTDDLADARWMTFAELAVARGISKDSAMALVRRKGWRRQRDNTGSVMALVPTDGPTRRRAASGEADHHAAAFETARRRSRSCGEGFGLTGARGCR